jgi:hypothetical protein
MTTARAAHSTGTACARNDSELDMPIVDVLPALAV